MGKRWFAAVNKGIGWKPATWQGWFIICLYIIGIFASFFLVFTRADTLGNFIFNFTVQFLVLTVILSFICYFTGEKPRT